MLAAVFERIRQSIRAIRSGDLRLWSRRRFTVCLAISAWLFIVAPAIRNTDREIRLSTPAEVQTQMPALTGDPAGPGDVPADTPADTPSPEGVCGNQPGPVCIGEVKGKLSCNDYDEAESLYDIEHGCAVVIRGAIKDADPAELELALRFPDHGVWVTNRDVQHESAFADSYRFYCLDPNPGEHVAELEVKDEQGEVIQTIPAVATVRCTY